MKKTVFILLFILCFSIPAAAGLQGKVILINAGHGGGETGAIGPTGLVERDINLKVAVYLKEMLEAAGAKVIMTHTSVLEDLDGTAHYSGTRDRYNRLAVGRENNVDILLFLHHNSNSSKESRQIEVYYMPKYHGPSKELAEYVTKGLIEHMGWSGITTTMSQTIVNHATIPTIIGEPGYISNPELEEWYRSDENLKREAMGYFVGVERFFVDGMPVIKTVTPEMNQKLIQDRPAIVARIATDGISPINPRLIQVRVDNKVIPHEFDVLSGLITARVPDALPNGPHTLLIIGRNMAGIAAVPVDFQFYVDEKPAKLVLDRYPTYVPGVQESVVKISGRLLDDDGQPVMDGNQVRFETEYEGYAKEPWVFTRDGRFVNYILPKEGPEICGIRIWAGSTAVMQEIVVDYRSKDAYLYGAVKNTATGRTLTGMDLTLIAGDGKELKTVTDLDGGYFFSEVPTGSYRLVIEQAGYETYSKALELKGSQSQELNPEITPIAGGALMGRKIILNTAVEGTAPGADVITRSLQARLERAGAIVTLVDQGTDDLATVKMINKLMGQFLLSIKITDKDQAVVHHYPKSEKNEKLAKSLQIEGLDVKTEGAGSRLVTGANTQSLIIEIPVKAFTPAVVDGIYRLLVEYFKTVK